MVSPSAPPRPRRDPKWPDNHARPELRSLRGSALRTFSLLSLFTLWVVGLGSYVAMSALTLYALGRRAVAVALEHDASRAAPLPVPVQLFLVFLAVYWGYHFAVPTKWHEWPWMRVLARRLNMDYPYFRFNACVFDELDSDDPVASAMSDSPLRISDSPLRVNDKALFAFHPHGVLTCGMTVNAVHHARFAVADVTWLVAESLFLFPMLRDMLHWTNFSDVSKQRVVGLMRAGKNIGLIPGGFEEATLYERGRHRVFIKSRFGFIKLALQHGYKIYPTYTFGEEFLYHTFPYLLRWRLMLNTLKVPGAVFFGRLVCFFLPRNDVDVITVVDKPLILPTIAHPTREDVAKYHAQYVSRLQALFDKHKATYAVDPDARLEVY